MLYKVLLLISLFEIATIIGRLIWGSKQAKFKKNTSKYKIRIHHGYTGVIILLSSIALSKLPYYTPSIIQQNMQIIIIFGWAFFISDAIHHFIVLPLWVKRTEFP